MEWLSAITFGLLSGFHCAGMCGPIAFALPLDRSSKLSALSGALTYNVFRLLTYGTLGGMFGLLGRGFYTAGFQRGLSIAVGLGLVAAAVFPVLFKKVSPEAAAYRIFGRLRGRFSKLFQSRTVTALAAIGIFNGLLPCGMVYWALAGAVVSGTAHTGFLYLIVFGIGTLPVMLTASFLGNKLSPNVRSQIRRFIPFIMALLGVLFIVRGLNLDIPYLSPYINRVIPGVTYCD